jgi:hypothetical protein
MAVQMFTRGPVLVEHEAAGVGGMNVQVVLHAAFLGACGFDEREEHSAEVVFLAGPGFQLGDDGQRLRHIVTIIAETRRSRASASGRELIFLQLAVERSTSDPQQVCGDGAIAFGVFESVEDCATFQHVQRDYGRERLRRQW